jgi:DHA1 family bicyclomycin/chloramphenicol resistance-like MFS transporter
MNHDAGVVDYSYSKTKLATMVLLCGLSLLSVFPLDILLPSYPALANEFDKSVAEIASSISFFIMVFAISQLIVGPLSDKFGRKLVLIAGLAIVLASVVACALAKSFNEFFTYRLLQAVGCSSFVLSQALIQDLLREDDRQRARIFLISVSGVFIAIAPLLGSYIQDVFGWQGSFYLSAIVALYLMFQAVVTLSNKKSSEFDLKSIFIPYGEMIRHKSFVTNWCMAGIAFSCHFSFVIVSPVIFFQGLGLSSYQYSYVLLTYGVSYVLGGVVAGWLRCKISLSFQVVFGFILIMVAGFLLLWTVFFLNITIASIVVPMIVCTAGTTICRPAAATKAMEYFNSSVGAASSAGATIVFLIAAVVSVAISFSDSYVLLFLAGGFIVLSFLGLVLCGWLVLEKMGAPDFIKGKSHD